MPLEHINLARNRLSPAGAATARRGSTSGSETAAGQVGEKFTATQEELLVIQEKMKDPVFSELMHEYMKSLEDPETRREEEAYLEQAEREAREGGDFSFEFVFPRAAFVVELLESSNTAVSAVELKKLGFDTSATTRTAAKTSSARSFLNFCSSEKVKAFTERTTGDAKASNWEVPVSVSQRRVEAYQPVKSSPSASIPAEYVAACDSAFASSSSPSVCVVRDVVFHPSTLALAERSPRFMCFLAEIAVEHINSGYGESNGFRFRRLPSSIVSIGTPLNQTIRSSSRTGGSLFDADPRAPVLTRPTKNLPAVKDSDCSPSTASPSPSTTSAKALTSLGTGGAKGPKGTVSEAAAASATSSKTAALPPYTITHRGSVDLSDAWQWRVSDKRVGVPEELIVKLTFAGVRRASVLDIAITPDGQAVRIDPTEGQGRYEGLLVLPFTVEEAPRKAQFDCSRGVLTLTLKVVPPPLPDGAPNAEQLRKALQGETGDAVDECIGEFSEKAAINQQSESQSSHCVPSSSFAEVGVNALAKETAASPASVTRAESPEKTSAEPLLPTPAAPTSRGPELAHIGDQDRVAVMMAQVRAAREAREAAAGTVDIEKPDASVPASPSVPTTALCVSVDNGSDKSDEQMQHTAVASASDSAQAEVTAAHEKSQEAIPFIRKAPVTTATLPAADVGDEEGDDIKTMRARQQAWAAMIEAEMQLTRAREEAETLQAAQEAEVQAAKARRKIAAEKELERLTHAAREKRNSLPLSNKYIFSID
ncbi:preRNA processing PIH1 [Leishmania braziliensis]|nr:preRNA processing PIH1 [Leishmania braziliensis]